MTHCQKVLALLSDYKPHSHHSLYALSKRKVRIDSPEYPHVLRARLLTRTERDETTGCWIWTGGKTTKGYASINAFGGPTRAHRVAYRLFVGEIPEGKELDHLCRTPACINPDHLEPVTHAVNVKRGRVGANMRDRTHCKQGHEFTEENTGRRSDCEGRICLTCQRAATVAWRERNRELLRARDRRKKRELREARGVLERWPGRVHPRYAGEAA